MYKAAWRIYKVFNTTTQLLTLIVSFTAKGHFSPDQCLSRAKEEPQTATWNVHDSLWNKAICLKPKLCFSQWKAFYLTVLLYLPLWLTKHKDYRLVVIRQIELLLQKSHFRNKGIYKNANLSLLLKSQYRISVAVNTNIYRIYFKIINKTISEKLCTT